MISVVLLGLAALLGAGSSFSGAINSFIGREIGFIRATFLFLSLGSGLAWLLMLLFDEALSPAGLVTLFSKQPYLAIPGLVNGLLILVIIQATAAVGTTITTACLFSGQMSISLWLDHIGFAGLRTIPINPGRLVALVALLVGVVLLSGSRQRAESPTTDVLGLGATGSKRPNPLAMGGVLVVGGLLSGANSLNAALGQAAGVFTATLFFLGPGVVLLPLLSAAFVPPTGSGLLKSWQPLYLMPGILNVLYIAGSVFLVPILGVQTMTSTVFTAKVFTGLLIDRYGWFGVPQSPLTSLRLAAAFLLSLGVFLSSVFS
ncbi:hypothetical protein GFS31_15070 [Leptolyngbya sp. BL0902]|uniref:DMT family transporter n=1 Tax=Leptolyngbya sp. BL0902 TaxID=1115757 RepID=UPI0018E83600|nr:DMT family transporter [Leptolyngbya sp. BL0902]QQE64824.1 hypothetical protein GFS31_15070 [Leptolyngbya sp. BL0902]